MVQKIFLGILILIALGLGIGLYFKYSIPAPKLDYTPIVPASPTVAPTIASTPTITPTQAPAQTITGTVQTISHASYLNSTLVIINSNGKSYPFYVHMGTKIMDAKGVVLTINSFATGQKVSAVGTPIEGGLNCTSITITH